MIDEMHLKYSLDDTSADKLSVILDAVEDKVRALTQRDRFSEISSSSKPASNACTAPAASTGDVMALYSRTDINPKRENMLSTVVNQLLGVVATMENEFCQFKSKVNNNNNNDNRDYYRRSDDRRDRDYYRPSSRTGRSQLPPFFHETPDGNYDQKGRIFDGRTYHFKADARDRRGGWYDDYVPTTKKHARFVDEASKTDRDDKRHRTNNESHDGDSNDSGRTRSATRPNERIKRLQGLRALIAVHEPTPADSSKSGRTE